MIQEIYGKGLEPVDIVRRIIDDLKSGEPKTGVKSRRRANWVINELSDSGWGSEFKQPLPAPAGSRFAGAVVETSKAARRREKKAVSLMIQAAIDGEWLAVGADKESGLQSIAPILWTRFKHDQAKIETPCSVTLGQAEFFGVRFVRSEDLTSDEREIWGTPSQNENKPLNVKYERTLLLFIAALLKDKNYTGTDRSETGKLERMLELQGVPLDAKTIRKVTKAAFTELKEHTENR